MAEREALALSPEDREHHDRRADVGDHQEDLKQSAQRDARIVPRPEDVVRVSDRALLTWLVAKSEGFEGLGLVGEAVDPDYEPVSKGESGRELFGDLDPVPSLEVPPIDGKNSVARHLDSLRGLDRHRNPCVVHVADPPPHSLAAEVLRVLAWRQKAWMELDLRIKMLQDAIVEVPAVPGREQVPDNFLVLLRHRGPVSRLSSQAGNLKKVDDGTRTHDRLDHNQELYQLSYVHRERPNLATANAISEPGTLAERPRHDSNVRPAD